MMKSVAVLVSVLVLVLATAVSAITLWGFETTNDVTNQAGFQAKLGDLNGAVALTNGTAKDWAVAKTAYSSAATAAVSMQSMSTSLGTMKGVAELRMKSSSSTSFVQAYSSYWSSTISSSSGCVVGTELSGCPNYADVQMQAILAKSGDYSAVSDAYRSQSAKKWAAFGAVWVYISAKLSVALFHAKSYNATTDTDFEGLTAAKGLLLMLDEAWAYFAGSQGVSTQVTSYYNTVSKDILFDQCGDKRNDKIRDAFNDAKLYGSKDTFDLAKFETAVTSIPPMLTVTLVQSCIRYLDKTNGKVVDPTSTTDGEAFGELWGFCAAVLPQMPSSDATTLRDMIDPAKKGNVDFGNGKKALENSYSRMGFSPSDIGTYKGDGPTYASVCSFAASLRPFFVSTAVAVVASIAAVFAA